jgi:hypothetical protein
MLTRSLILGSKLNMTTKEIWEMTLDEYLAPYHQAEEAANDAYDALYYKHCKVEEYPLNGNMWERYGQRLDAARETTALWRDPSYKRLQRERQRAISAVT